MTVRASEADCQASIVKAAELAGWLVHGERPAPGRRGEWRTHLQGHRGFPDLVLVRPPRILFVELKRKPNKVEPDQQVWLTNLAASGAEARVVYVPEQMQDFIADIVRSAA